MKKVSIYFIACLIIFTLLFFWILIKNPNTIDMNTSNSTTTSSANALKIEDITIGNGETVVNLDQTLTVHYKGTLLDGTVFDSSYDRNETADFKLSQVIDGWKQGIMGMKIGGKRKLTIPPELAYGNKATGKIPANSTLIFEVELLGIK